jgi:hypothetical protein
MENSFRFCGFTGFRSQRDYAVVRGSLTKNMMRLGNRIVGPEVDSLVAPKAEPPLDDVPHLPLHQRALPRWGLAVTAVCLLIMWQCGSGLIWGRKLANEAVEHFHQELNASRYDEIFREADPGLTEGKTKEDLVKFLQAVHTKLGEAGAVSPVSIHVNATTNGRFTTAQYKTTFTRGSAVETFTWIGAGSTLKLYGYDIR